MIGLVLAGLAGALLMGVAIEVWREVEAYDRRNRQSRDRAAGRRAAARYDADGRYTGAD